MYQKVIIGEIRGNDPVYPTTFRISIGSDLFEVDPVDMVRFLKMGSAARIFGKDGKHVGDLTRSKDSKFYSFAINFNTYFIRRDNLRSFCSGNQRAAPIYGNSGTVHTIRFGDPGIGKSVIFLAGA